MWQLTDIFWCPPPCPPRSSHGAWAAGWGGEGPLTAPRRKGGGEGTSRCITAVVSSIKWIQCINEPHP